MCFRDHLCAGPSQVSQVTPLRDASQFTVALWVSWTQAPLAFEVVILGAHLSGADLKRWGARCGGSNLLLPREKLRVLRSLLILGHCARCERLCLSFSYPFWCEFFSSLPDVQSCSASFGVPFRGNVSETFLYLAVDLVCSWEEVSFRTLLCHRLKSEPLLSVLDK